VEEWAGRIASDTGYAAVEHTVELTGICTACQPSGDEGEPPCRWERAPDNPGRAPSCAS
jgi:Fur family ferric uptake transcriptional regulator